MIGVWVRVRPYGEMRMAAMIWVHAAGTEDNKKPKGENNRFASRNKQNNNKVQPPNWSKSNRAAGPTNVNSEMKRAELRKMGKSVVSSVHVIVLDP